jgi:hypothetical protein
MVKKENKEALPKAEDLKDSAEVSRYDTEIEGVLNDYDKQLKSAKENAELSDTVFYNIGEKLLEVHAKIQSDYADADADVDDVDAKANKVKIKKYFAAFKLRVADKIQKNISNVDKVFKVAQFKQTDEFKKYANRLPDSWGTLYLLLSLKDEKLDELMADDDITKAMTRAALAKKISELNEPKAVKQVSLKFKLKSGKSITGDDIAKLILELDKSLSKNSKWKLVNPNSNSGYDDSSETASGE